MLNCIRAYKGLLNKNTQTNMVYLDFIKAFDSVALLALWSNSITGRLKSSDAIKVSDRDTSHTYEYTAQALAGGERIYGCKERPFIALA